MLSLDVKLSSILNCEQEAVSVRFTLRAYLPMLMLPNILSIVMPDVEARASICECENSP